MLNNTFEYTLHGRKTGNSASFIAIDITTEEERITLINRYGLKHYNPQFSLDIQKCNEELVNN